MFIYLLDSESFPVEQIMISENRCHFSDFCHILLLTTFVLFYFCEIILNASLVKNGFQVGFCNQYSEGVKSVPYVQYKPNALDVKCRLVSNMEACSCFFYVYNHIQSGIFC